MQIPFFIDADGTLTDGTVSYPSMERRFHLRDGHGISLLKEKTNIAPVIISGESDSSIRIRGNKLDVMTITPVKNKYDFVSNDLLVSTYIAISDDTPDLELLENATLAFCPADAHSEVLQLVNKHENGIILTRKGGNACVREAIDFILTQARVRKLFKDALRIE